MIDQGGHATRALVFGSDGRVVCQVESEITTIQQGELIVEHDPEQVLGSVYEVLEGVYNILGDDFACISEAGIATQRSSFVCWDKSTGLALTPIISWQDRRTANEMELYDEFKTEIYHKTGLYLNPHYGATKIRWCLGQNNFQHLDNLHIAPMASFILFHLLENKPFKIDPANASRTLLMNYKTLDWDNSLLGIFDISRKYLPTIVDTKADYGVINYKKHQIPLSICTGDQSAAIYFRGLPDKTSLYVNIGTGAFVQQYSEQLPLPGEEKLLASIVCSEHGKKSYVIEGTVNGAARALDWLESQINVANSSTQLDTWADKINSPPIFLNGISGVGSPYWIANLKSRFLGSTPMPIEAQFVAVMESIVFLIFSNITSMSNMGYRPESVKISGGLSQSRAICQKLSDLSGLIIKRDSVVEATAQGVYFLITGICEDVSNIPVMDFFPNKNKELSERYQLWEAEMKKVL